MRMKLQRSQTYLTLHARSYFKNFVSIIYKNLLEHKIDDGEFELDEDIRNPEFTI